MAKDPAGGKRGNKQIVASNRKARHNYSILELFEAGVALQGTEVKSLREGHASLADAFATVDDGEVWLRNLHIPEYHHGSWTNHEPRRNRKLLLHRGQIEIDLDLALLSAVGIGDGGAFHGGQTCTQEVGSYVAKLLFGETLAGEAELQGAHTRRHTAAAEIRHRAARHFRRARELGRKLEVAVALGGDPALTYAATAPLPDGIDEWMFAGFLRKRAVATVACKTVALEVPADADFVLEGYVDLQEDLIDEGPFGDHTGYYTPVDRFPRLNVTAITHRAGRWKRRQWP